MQFLLGASKYALLHFLAVFDTCLLFEYFCVLYDIHTHICTVRTS